MKYIKYINTKIGQIGIIEQNERIIRIDVNTNVKNKEECIEKETILLKNASKQLEDYLKGRRQKFDLPIEPEGTEFMKEVWGALQDIPYGETRSYKQIAEYIGKPNASRAVGMANHKNPIPIIIPCHRVIGSNGNMVGYALGIDMKKELLKIESKG